MPGNKIGEKSKGLTSLYKKDRQEIRKETIRCALLLTEKYADLKNRIQDKDLTNLEYLTAIAISKKDYKFITWLCEMAIGKPKEVKDLDDNGGMNVQIVMPENFKAKIDDSN